MSTAATLAEHIQPLRNDPAHSAVLLETVLLSIYIQDGNPPTTTAALAALPEESDAKNASCQWASIAAEAALRRSKCARAFSRRSWE